ncbi:MAG: 1-acyl-sn-glycerol-3-phosphate acyltransferase, partial [Planctomycetes bacterium]|nr:1-acyl-sn-glycerol-3-phosphate acyltransferase [Planctomycetota bacterium]
MSRRARGGFLATLDAFAFAVFRVVLRAALTLYFRMSVRGDRTLHHGPAIVVANHQSFLDSLLVGVAVRPRVRFVMTELFANVRGLRWFFRWNRVIIMREESSNREMFKQSLAALQNGEVLGIFPEGTISLDGSLSEFQPGALSMALRERVPIVPVALVGAHRALHRSMRFPRPRKIRVEVGAPIPPDELFPRSASRTEALEIGARLLQHRVEELSRRAEARGR